MFDLMLFYYQRFKDFFGFLCLSLLDVFFCCIYIVDVIRNIDFLIILGKVCDNYYDLVLVVVLKVFC